MEKTILKNQKLSPYQGGCVTLTTKHQKAIALASPFKKILHASVLEHVIDTDELGTFSGEVERQGTVLETARKKCEYGLAKSEYALASEGSFGPHPTMPFIPASRETLYFIDNKRKFHLHLTEIFTDTNYQMETVATLKELNTFAEKCLFPSHALIVRPYPRSILKPLFKGLQVSNDLETAFREVQKNSPTEKVWVETDMRAHVNPTRMRMIATLGEKMVYRLKTPCPKCQTPGWGRVNIETGLPCNWCGAATEEIKSEIYGCTKCEHKESVPPEHNKKSAEPGLCLYCNP